MHIKHVILMLLISLLTVCPFMPQEVFADSAVVITHSDIAPGSVDADTVKKIYSGNTTKWPDGTRIIVVTMDNAPIHEDFLKTYVNKTQSQFSATWKKIMFTGKGKFPTNFDTAEEVMDYVSKTPGAIGYVSAGANPQGVSVQK